MAFALQMEKSIIFQNLYSMSPHQRSVMNRLLSLQKLQIPTCITFENSIFVPKRILVKLLHKFLLVWSKYFEIWCILFWPFSFLSWKIKFFVTTLHKNHKIFHEIFSFQSIYLFLQPISTTCSRIYFFTIAVKIRLIT